MKIKQLCNFHRVEACSEDIRNDWVEEINAAIEKGKGRSFGNSRDDQLAEEDLPKELPGDVEPVTFPDDLAEYCQVKGALKPDFENFGFCPNRLDLLPLPPHPSP